MPIFQLTDEIIFPPVHYADPSGVLAIGGDLSTDRLVAAYQQGIFPWYSEGEPLLWWSPDPRFVLFPDELKISDSLSRIIKSNRFSVTFNCDFPAVISQCRKRIRRDQDGTWITEEMQQAYCTLHDMGIGQSVEVWEGKTLAGGLYGLQMGSLFCGESMFYEKSNASKVGFAALVEKLQGEGCTLIDCQVHTDHLESLGARPIAREEYLRLLKQALPSSPA